MSNKLNTRTRVLTKSSLTSLFAMLILLVSACSDNGEISPDEVVTIDTEAVTKFSNFLSNYQLTLKESEDGLKDSFERGSANLENADAPVTEAEAQELIKPVLNESLAFLYSLGFTKNEIESEYGSVDSAEIIGLAFVMLIEADERQGGDGSIAAPLSENNIWACAFTATGLRGLWQLPSQISAGMGKKAILKVVGKFMVKQLGWVGWALAVGEFIGCYWGGNSIVEF